MKIKTQVYRGRTIISLWVNSNYVGHIAHFWNTTGWLWQLGFNRTLHGVGKNMTKSEAMEALLNRRKGCLKAARTRKNHPKCICRAPKTHRDCAYCGCGGPCTHICGVCKEAGIDGKCIPGTARVICKLHKAEVSRV